MNKKIGLIVANLFLNLATIIVVSCRPLPIKTSFGTPGMWRALIINLIIGIIIVLLIKYQNLVVIGNVYQLFLVILFGVLLFWSTYALKGILQIIAIFIGILGISISISYFIIKG